MVPPTEARANWLCLGPGGGAGGPGIEQGGP